MQIELLLYIVMYTFKKLNIVLIYFCHIEGDSPS
jgi:hypothetical protein